MISVNIQHHALNTREYGDVWHCMTSSCNGLPAGHQEGDALPSS